VFVARERRTIYHSEYVLLTALAEEDPMKGLPGKSAVVAGGGQGMGAAVARRLASEGSRVVVGDLREERAKSVVAEIEQAGGTAVARQFDISDQASVQALIAHAVASFGGLDLLANVAANVGPGAAIGRDTDIVDESVDTWHETLAVNVTGYMLSCRHAIPEMLKRGGGAIVNISSGASVIGGTTMAAYGVSKAGVESLTRHIVGRWQPEGIRANAIAPGLIHTPTADRWFTDHHGMTKGQMDESASLLHRAGAPEEIAAAVAFLLSDECPFLTGQVIAVNGGNYLSPL
jgi:NAD(P)-dependent dehydrogenase (short-subunit alcohol dehydrogenase family)